MTAPHGDGIDWHVSFSFDNADRGRGNPLSADLVVSLTEYLLLRVGRTATGTSIRNGALQKFRCVALSGGAFT